MALDACVKNVLCGLDGALRTALQTAINTAKVALQAQLASLQAALTVLDITLAPVELIKDALTLVKDQANALNKLLPTNLFNGCVDLGNLVQGINLANLNGLGGLENALKDASRLLGARDEIEGEIAAINKQLETIGEIESIFSECQ